MIRSGVVGPKPRPSGVGDGEQVHIPAPARARSSGRGDATGKLSRPTGHGRWPLVAWAGRNPAPDVRGGPRTGYGLLRVSPAPLSPRKASPRGRVVSVPQTDAGGLGEPS